jgi:CDP-4-dehydro-6-deoxyglucose reductase, E3
MTDKTVKIKIPHYNLSYQIKNNKNIIDASLDKNIKLAYSCKSGICGTCKAKIIKGKVKKNKKIDYILSESERKNKIVLLCQSEALTKEIEIEPLSPLPKEISLTKVREIVSEVLSIKIINKNIKEISISVPKRFTYIYENINYVEILIPGAEKLEKYFINTTINDAHLNNGVISLFIIKNENSKINNYIKKNFIQGETLTLKGPYEEIKIETPRDFPLLFLVENNSIINTLNTVKNLLLKNFSSPIMLLCNFNNKEDIILLDEMHKINFLYNNFSYKISLLKNNTDNINRFLIGKTSSILHKIFPDLSNHYIFIYGKKKFITLNFNKALELGAIKDNIHIKL